MSFQTPPPPPAWHDTQPVAVAGAIGPPAGFWIRFVACLIDGLILGVIAGVIVGAMVIVATANGVGFHSDEDENVALIVIGMVLGGVALIVVSWLYEALMTSSRHGATFGKRALGLRIVRADGAPLSFGRATARHFLKVMITPLVPFAIGYLLAAFTAGKRALHDFMADTLVIRTS